MICKQLRNYSFLLKSNRLNRLCWEFDFLMNSYSVGSYSHARSGAVFLAMAAAAASIGFNDRARHAVILRTPDREIRAELAANHTKLSSRPGYASRTVNAGKPHANIAFYRKLERFNGACRT